MKPNQNQKNQVARLKLFRLFVYKHRPDLAWAIEEHIGRRIAERRLKKTRSDASLLRANGGANATRH